MTWISENTQMSKLYTWASYWEMTMFQQVQQSKDRDQKEDTKYHKVRRITKIYIEVANLTDRIQNGRKFEV